MDVIQRPTLVLDLDGTVRDTSGIAHLITGKDKRYDEFQLAAATCPPIPRTVAVIRQRFLGHGWRVVIASGQKEKYREGNEAWVARHLGDVDWMILRHDEDNRKPAVVKREMLWRMRAWGWDPTEAWDDDPAVVAMYNEERLDVHWVFNQTRVS